MRDSTALILISVVFMLFTLWAVIISAPISACAVLCGSGLIALIGGFVCLNLEHSITK